MSGFSTDWLALREPFDRAARAAADAALDWPALTTRLRAGLAPDAPLAVLDLGCGTGANLREIAPRLGGTQHWRLVDHDPALLAAAPAALARWARDRGLQAHAEAARLRIAGAGLQVVAEFCHADLAHGLDALGFDGVQLVTASALLDLVGADWLAALVARCHGAGAAVCWALNVDDRLAWQPPDADDAMVQALFQAHQRRDKGFGPALGGTAAALAVQALHAAGYRTVQARSDWCIDGRRGPDAQAMWRAMVEGMGVAATEQAPEQAVRVRAWQARRLAQAGQAQLHVGHVEVLGWR
ncbi:class I SAM-dependent methyltransferase [Pseudorhodoferax sp.]|uniref:class I SAM-dependent methyltransferase n=1 Tax=Pseudorhodoferax sp. TaxID=1993553 RepID=UPI002DD6488E|nr:class I SAM-dependent methyltransferase [Pseudorhodoferax sp.]